MRSLLDGESPGAAPAERAEPDSAVLLIGRSVDGKPRVRLMTGGAAAALQHFLARMDFLMDELRFACPTSVQVSETVAFARRHVPDARLRALHRDRLGSFVFDDSVLFDDSRGRINTVVEVHKKVVLDILGHNLQRVAMNFVTDVAKNQIAIPILQGHFETWFCVHVASPARVLTWRGSGGAIEGCPFGRGANWGKVGVTPQFLAPIYMLELIVFVHSKYVAGVIGVENEQLFGGDEANGILSQRGRAQ